MDSAAGGILWPGKTEALKKLSENEDYSDILDIIGQDDDISDEDVALYANIDIDTVKRIREKWVNEELVNPYKKQPGRN